MKLVTKSTRAKKHGTGIVCPKCKTSYIVHHFAWSELTCQNCEISVPKFSWILYGFSCN